MASSQEPVVVETPAVSDPPATVAEYVVQLRQVIEVMGATGTNEAPGREKRVVWIDLATIKLPPRSHRTRAIKLALAEAGVTPDPENPPVVRVLDADSARVVEVPVVVSEPTFAI